MNGPGGQRVHADIQMAQLDGQGARHGVDRALGGGVEHAAGNAGVGVDGTDHADRAPLIHQLHRLLTAKEGTLGVGVDHRVPILLGGIEDAHIHGQMRGVGNENIQPPPGRLHLGERGADGGNGIGVHAQAQRLNGGKFLAQPGGRVQGVLLVTAGDSHAVALPGEALGDGPAGVPGGPGDKHIFHLDRSLLYRRGSATQTQPFTSSAPMVSRAVSVRRARVNCPF